MQGISRIFVTINSQAATVNIAEEEEEEGATVVIAEEEEEEEAMVAEEVMEKG